MSVRLAVAAMKSRDTSVTGLATELGIIPSRCTDT